MIHTLIITNKDKSLKERSHSLHQHHMANLSVVTYIKEALLSNSSFMTDFDDNKLLLTISSYIHFEEKYSIAVHERNLRVEDNTNMVASYDSLFNVSSISLRCLTQIIRIWELSPVSRRPSLVAYLSYSENGFSNIDIIISRALLNPEEACELLKFLIYSMNSQSAFINGLFKKESFFQSIIDTF